MRILMKSRYSAIDEKLFFLLGVLSTMQVLSVCGITLFTLILYITFIYILLSSRRFIIADKMVVIYLLFIGVSVSSSIIFSSVSSGYASRVIKTFINISIMLLVYLLSSNNSMRCKKFLQGFVLSCKVQLYYCLIQIVCINFLNIDINNLIFTRMFNMTTYQTQQKNGRIVCTGLHWHSANLIPILLYLYLFSKSWLTKALCILVAFVSQNTTAIITLGFCIIIDISVKLIKYLKQRNKRIDSKKVLITLIGVVIMCVMAERIMPYVIEKISGLIYRFTALSGDLKGGEGDVGISSLTHLNYYRNMFKIMYESSPINIILGYGLDSSGYIYSIVFKQYENVVWVIESDIVNIAINIGIVGFIIYYWLVVRIMILAIKKRMSYKYVVLVLAVIMGGITYNIQFTWVLLLELVIYSIMKAEQFNENRIFNKGEEHYEENK